MLSSKHAVDEMVRDLKRARCIALVVAQIAFKRNLVEEAGSDVSSVIEDQRDVNVLGRLDYGWHVSISNGEVGGNLAELQGGMFLGDLGIEIVKEFVGERNKDHIDPLLNELLHNTAADP